MDDRRPDAASLLSYLQLELQEVHAVENEHSVDDFVISGQVLESLAQRTPEAEEEVLVLEEAGELAVAVYLAPRVLEALRMAENDIGALMAHGLSSFLLAVEGVSHFVYLTNRAAIPRPVSLLELEVQAEIDKFALCALHLARRGKNDELTKLAPRLFDEVTYLPNLSAEARERYQTANALAGRYCRTLLRYLHAGRIDALLRDLRAVYRLGASDKYGRLRRPV